MSKAKESKLPDDVELKKTTNENGDVVKVEVLHKSKSQTRREDAQKSDK